MTENGMTAMLCGCGQRLEAGEAGSLCERVAAHLTQDHLTTHVDRKLVQVMVATRAYKVEYVKVYANGSGPDEEFGLEPY